MQAIQTALALAAIGTLAWSTQQAVPQAPAPGLTPVPPSAPSASAPAAVPIVDFDAGAWARRLGTDDFDQRARALDEVAGLSRRSPAARAALEAWAADPARGELAWTAYLALRQAERVAQGPFRGFPFGGQGQAGLGAPAPAPRGLGGLPFGQGLQLRSSQGLTIETTPDGVTVRVEVEDADGERRVEEYTAESLDALLEAHPELGDRLGPVHFGGSFGQGLDGEDPFAELFGQLPDFADLFGGGPGAGAPFAPRFGTQPPAPIAPPLLAPLPPAEGKLEGGVRTDLLGVYVDAEASAEVQGIFVRDVLPGTIADAVGLGAGDLVVQVDGRRVASSGDIAAVLAERAAGATVRVRWIDAAGATHDGSWTPAAIDG